MVKCTYVLALAATLLGAAVQGGQVIVVPRPVQLTIPVDFPIVNDGFASDADVRGSIDPLLEALKSADFAKREAATSAMLRLPPKRVDDVVEALARTTDPESI